MQRERFEVGDLVRLKSGSPSMVVEQADDGVSDVLCMWFMNGELRNRRFPAVALQFDDRGRS